MFRTIKLARKNCRRIAEYFHDVLNIASCQPYLCVRAHEVAHKLRATLLRKQVTIINGHKVRHSGSFQPIRRPIEGFYPLNYFDRSFQPGRWAHGC